MKGFIISSGFTGLIFGGFLFGMFTNNALFFGVSFCLWTPAILWLGYSLANAGLHLRSPIATNDARQAPSRPMNPRRNSQAQTQGVEFK